MIKVYIFNKSNDVSRFDVFKSSLSVLTPKYLWRAAPKQMQSIKMCLTVRGEWQIWHSGSLLLEDTNWWVSYDQFEDGW